MFGLAVRLIGGVITPLVDQASAASARLLRKLALFVVAGLALIVVLIALTLAFDLWIASMKGPIVGALAVAGVYFGIAVIALLVALWPRKTSRTAAKETSAAPETAAKPDVDAQVDDFAAPLLAILQRLGLRREQLAVLAGASVAKQVGPVPLVGLAIVGGFVLGRMWRRVFSTDLIATLLSSDLLAGLFTPQNEASDDAGPSDEKRDAA